MHISELDYVLPPELIAQEPLPERDASRLMVVHRATKTIEHRMFRDLPAFLRPGDLVVLNDTKVKPVRLYGKRSSTGGAVEIFLLDELRDGRYHAMTGSGGKLDAGERVLIVETDKPDAQPRLMAILENKLDDGTWNIRMEVCGGGGRTDAIATLVNEIASMPLPPYIKRTRFDDPRSKQDRQRYQTVFACKEGAVAAPTAGLHFTAEMLEGLARNGVERCFVTLHVGRGTFLPVKVES
ncbi:MAG: S-adenosylmethionine:tRNA ribosyltransferase-isomerase, partial [Planctomycetes bacterium]|nr:S-adenosylmethionine:tRNA ribosyltransferase-isomerase [Planctomycetota bacterium]